MNDLSEQARRNTPKRATVIIGSKGDQAYYCVLNERYSWIKNPLNGIDCFLVEIHPIVKFRRGPDGLKKELFRGTSRTNSTTNRIYLNVDYKNDIAFFGPLGAIALDYDLQGYGFGSYMFNELVKWGKRLHGSVHVRKGSLALADARDEESRQRRNQFYRQFGFELVPEDPLTGIFRVNTLGNLKPLPDFKRIRVAPHQPRIIDAYPNFNLTDLQEEIVNQLQT